VGAGLLWPIQSINEPSEVPIAGNWSSLLLNNQASKVLSLFAK